MAGNKTTDISRQSGPTKRRHGFIPGMTGMLAVLLIAGALLVWWSVQRADHGMRRALLLQARLVARSLNVENIRTLSGNETDRLNPAYLEFKRQLFAVNQAHDRARFIYLLGRGPDGTIFIFVDNEPPDSEDYSPPGQVYEEATPALQQLFSSGTEAVLGPETDRWGTWVSAHIPLHDPRTGHLIAVLGMDVDARDWQRVVLTEAVWPMGLIVLVMVLLALSYALAFSRRRALDYQTALQQSHGIMARASAETERQHRLLESLLDAIPAPVFFKDRNGLYLGCNPAFEAITGKKEADIIGKKPHEIWPEKFSSTYRDKDMELLETGGKQQYEYKYSGADGSERDVVFYKSTFIDATGEIDGIVGVMLDITERKNTEMELRRLKLAVEQTIDGIGVADLDGNIVFVNKAWALMHGYELAELAGVNLNIFHTGEQMRTEVFPFNEKVMSAGNVQGEVGHVRKDGSIFPTWMSSSLMRDERMRPVGLVAVARDITEQKKAEKELLRLRQAMEQVGDMIVITDAEGTIQYVNPAFERVTGYGRQEVLGQNPRLLKSGRQDQVFYQDLWATITSGGTWQGRMVNMRRDGTFYTEESTISPVFENDGRIVNFAAVKRDITEHLRLSAQLIQAQKMESVGRLAGGVAHDFNNMLNVIIGHAELAIDSLDPGDPSRDDLQEILGAARRSAEITRQLLAFARKQTITPETLDLNAVLEGMLKMLQRLAGEDIYLVWRPGPDLWPIHMDPAQIDQILANLLVNSRDAIAGTGRVIIETGNESPDESFCADHAGMVPGNYVLLAVSDNGRGMDKAMLAKLFEPFYTTKSASEGAGLGLATVYGIVKQNNGYIYAESEPGQGTTFRVYLPRHAGKSDRSRANVPAEISPDRLETVLIVEDEPSILKLTRRILEKQGYTVLTAADPTMAQKAAEERPVRIDLLITDVIMPGMNGRELAERLQSLHAGLKVLYMSGYAADVIGQRGALDTDVHFIPKPFSNQGLVEKVREALED